MKALIILSLFLLASCASTKNYQEKKVALSPNKNFWIGKSADELELHPVFATMPMQKRKAPGVEMRSFKQSRSSLGMGVCNPALNPYGLQMPGSCLTSSQERACHHSFTIEKNKISNYLRTGDCSDEESAEMRPRNPDGSIVYLDNEMEQIRKLASEKE